MDNLYLFAQPSPAERDTGSPRAGGPPNGSSSIFHAGAADANLLLLSQTTHAVLEGGGDFAKILLEKVVVNIVLVE